MDTKLPYITVRQAAHRSGKSAACIYNAVGKGDLHYTIVDGVKMLDRVKFEDWAANVRPGPKFKVKS